MSLFAPLASLGATAAGLALSYAGYRSIRHPPNRPEVYRKRARAAHERLVVCAGDSITHGAVSFDYVAALERSLGAAGHAFVNGGINGDLAYNLLQRLDAIVACDPDVVTVLIGTNDVMGSSVPAMARGQVIAKGLPRSATLDWYEANLRAIVARLKAETRARIALVTLPLLGDVLDSDIHQAVRRGSAIVERVAAEHGVAVIDFGRALEGRQREAGHVGRVGFRPDVRSFWWMGRAPMLRYLTGASFDRISDGIGLYATTDLVHLNERSGALLAALIESFLREPAP